MTTLEKHLQSPHDKQRVRSLAASDGSVLATEVVKRAEQYLQDLKGEKGLPLHEMVHAAVDRALIAWAMGETAGNQLAGSRLLGINRNTLRAKLASLGLAAEAFTRK